MTDEEFNQRMDKLAARHEALNRAIERRDKELEAIGAQLASINVQLEALANKHRR
jgi:prefoldin subunit 5